MFTSPGLGLKGVGLEPCLGAVTRMLPHEELQVVVMVHTGRDRASQSGAIECVVSISRGEPVPFCSGLFVGPPSPYASASGKILIPFAYGALDVRAFILEPRLRPALLHLGFRVLAYPIVWNEDLEPVGLLGPW